MRHLIPILVALGWVSCAGHVAAQGAAPKRPPDPPPAQLALAQVCASEASVQTETDDCAAIAQVFRRRGRRVGFTTIASRYSTRVFQRDRRDGRRWLAHLDATGRRPEGWPARLPWQTWRGRWLALYAHAGAILAGEVPSPCERPPDHWGGSMDDWRAIKAGWHRVDCGRTLNHFWAVRPVGSS